MKIVFLAIVLLAGCGATEEARLIEVLRSGAPAQEKAEACRALAVAGTGAAAPALAALLDDPVLGDHARIGLEAIPDPAAGEALRGSLGRLSGAALAGAANSLGARREAASEAPLARLVEDPDPEVAAAAAAALGRIGTSAAADALARALAAAPPERREAVAAGCLLAADALRRDGKAARAAVLLDAVAAAPDVPGQLRIQALRGAILARGAGGIPLLAGSLRSGDREEFAMALGAARELEGDGVTAALAVALPEVAPERRPLLLDAIASRGGPGALEAVLAAAREGPVTLRRAALASLAKLGDPAAIPVLVEAAGGEDPGAARAAADSLGALPGGEADAAVLGLLRSDRRGPRLAAIGIAGRRRLEAALPALRGAAAGEDREMRRAALAALGAVMGAGELPFLLGLLAAAGTGEEAAEIVAALAAAARRAPDRDAWAAVVVEAAAGAPPERMARFLEALRAVGGLRAARAVAGRARDPDPALRAAAIAVLGRWRDEAAPPVLLDLVEGSADPVERVAALRGWRDLVKGMRFSKEERLAQCRRGLAAARDAGERRIAIDACRGIPAPETMDLLVPLLADPELREDAAAALVGMSQRVLRFKPEAVARALPLVLAATGDAELRARAEGLLRNAGGKP